MKTQKAHFSVERGELDQGTRVLRDGQPLTTPAGQVYAVPTEALAEAIAAEWSAQAEKTSPDPAFMPMTCLAATALDRIAPRRVAVIETLAGFAHGDTLCYRAETPPALAQRQQEIWQPLLDWCAAQCGVRLCIGTGIVPVAHAPEALATLGAVLERFDAFYLSGLSVVADATGSIVLALAMAMGARDPHAVVEAAELDMTFQTMTWGADPVLEARSASIRCDIDDVGRWLTLLSR